MKVERLGKSTGYSVSQNSSTHSLPCVPSEQDENGLFLSVSQTRVITIDIARNQARSFVQEVSVMHQLCASLISGVPTCLKVISVLGLGAMRKYCDYRVSSSFT